MQDRIIKEPEKVQEIFGKIRKKHPLIHMIPNNVSASFCADGLSVLGARPLMAVAPQEMQEIVAQADGVVINLGQLTAEKSDAASMALEAVVKEQKPVVLDPVGCGASEFRLSTVQKLLEISWEGIIKGNQSEVYSIQQGLLTREGIDACRERSLLPSAEEERIFLVSGETDRILWKNSEHKFWKKENRKYNIVGTGCLLGAVTGACYSVEADKIQAAQAAALGMMYAIEQAEKAESYGRAKEVLLDALSRLGDEAFLEWMKGKER